ncbi:hypothetical protein AYL99_11705 [Fonsecaea erecta]|uniref:Uncharacterized protein n=1 Tax=Fonsecaea erecta TaxID=1367422 RepID=A0A178Z335_9EURO|nr:hypothetical protein AYL99_11705 [Fonsecaea erecta]OAP54170.1 hypothetical protein AYL99_11705 [Fonsecaea erecta]
MKVVAITAQDFLFKVLVSGNPLSADIFQSFPFNATVIRLILHVHRLIRLILHFGSKACDFQLLEFIDLSAIKLIRTETVARDHHPSFGHQLTYLHRRYRGLRH